MLFVLHLFNDIQTRPNRSYNGQMFKEKKDWERVLQQLPADKVNKHKSLAQIDAKFEEKHPTDLSVQVDRLLDAGC